jgi:hypothetical protein
MRLQDFKISTKIICSIVALAAIVLGGTVFIAREMRSIDDAYSSFLAKDSVSWVDAVRLRATTMQISSLAYHVVVESDDTKMRSMVDQIGQADIEFKKDSAEIKSLTPQYNDRINAILQAYADMQIAVKPVIDFGLKNDYANANKAANTRFEPAIGKLMDTVEDLRAAIRNDVNKGSDDLTSGCPPASCWVASSWASSWPGSSPRPGL